LRAIVSGAEIGSKKGRRTRTSSGALIGSKVSAMRPWAWSSRRVRAGPNRSASGARGALEIADRPHAELAQAFDRVRLQPQRREGKRLEVRSHLPPRGHHHLPAAIAGERPSAPCGVRHRRPGVRAGARQPLHKVLQQLGLSAEQVGDACGVDPEAIDAIDRHERGVAAERPERDTLQRRLVLRRLMLHHQEARYASLRLGEGEAGLDASRSRRPVSVHHHLACAHPAGDHHGCLSRRCAFSLRPAPVIRGLSCGRASAKS
jgi:hypothetical protein